MAAILSFVVPGAGQAWAGRLVRGLVLLAPLLVLAVAGGVVLATQGVARTIGLALQPETLIGFVVLNLAVAGWRLFATIDAYRLADSRWPGSEHRAPRLLAAGVLAALLVLIVGMHLGLGWVGLLTYQTVTTVFEEASPDPTPISTPTPTPGPTATPRPEWSPTPAPTPAPPLIWSSDGRLDLLLMGLDEGPGRFSLRPDALMLLSVDVATAKAALFAIPRYLSNVPLPPRSVNAFACRCFPGYINALFRHAEDHPEWFAGPDRERGLRATEEAIGAMTDLHLDGRLVVNFRGFIRLVDALGGLNIYVPYPIYDPQYPRPDGTGTMEISFAPGGQWMDGSRALAFARTRHQDSDYDRMWRQQLVLVAFRRQMNPCRVIPRIPELLDIAGASLSTNLPIEQLPDLLDLVARVGGEQISLYQFWPPDIPNALNADGLAKIRAMVRDPFAAPPIPRPGASPTPGPSGPPQPAPAPAC